MTSHPDPRLDNKRFVLADDRDAMLGDARSDLLAG